MYNNDFDDTGFGGDGTTGSGPAPPGSTATAGGGLAGGAFNVDTGGGTPGAGGGGGRGGGGGGKGGRRDQSLLPVTVHQALSAAQGDTDDAWRIDDREASQVTVVGFVKTSDHKSSHVTYEVDDGTGVIEVRQYQNQDDADDADRELIKEGAYVRATGSIRASGASGSKHMTAFALRPVSDHNELTFHILEVCHTHVIHKYGAGAFGGKAGRGVKGAATGAGGAAGTAPRGGSGPANLEGGLDSDMVQSEIKTFIEASAVDEKGVHMDKIAEHLGARCGGSELVKKAVFQMVEDGVLYSTVDDDHFLST